MMTHDDAIAEELRLAICEDEVIQAIGRGRGVNRTKANSLKVHVLGTWRCRSFMTGSRPRRPLDQSHRR